MARLAIGALMGVVVGMTLGAACNSHAQTADDETTTLAKEAGISESDWAGALSSQPGLDARAYLAFLTAPETATGEDWPIGGAVGQRIFCIEAIESRHGAAMYNPQPVWNGEHAAGWLGFLPSTARRWGVVIGNRASEWQGAATMLRAGAGTQFAGVAWGEC